jgi:hypothetical protein
MKTWLFLGFTLICSFVLAENPALEKSACFAFVDHDYIFTLEIVEPGVPILNFVSMTDTKANLLAKNIRLKFENRAIAGQVLVIEGGDFQQPMVLSTLTMQPRSSFGVRINGDFGQAKELFGVTIRLGVEDFKLVPLNSYDFDALEQKVNRLNLRSPDFSEDFRVLRLQLLGTRSPARKDTGSNQSHTSVGTPGNAHS